MSDHGWLWPIGVSALKSLVLLVCLLIYTAYFIYAERKIWAAVQLRRGPNVVGPWGLLQSFADLLKFVFKEPIIPAGANKGVFLLAPLVTAVLALSAWAVIPVNDGWAVGDINVGVLYLFAISSLGVYGIIMAGWSSNSKYPFLAALRSAAQMVSYEVSMGFVIITVLLCAGSLNLSEIVERAGFPLGTARLVLAAAVSDVHHLLRFRRSPRPIGRRSTSSRRNRNWSPASPSNIRRRRYLLFFLGELRRDPDDVRLHDDPVSRRLAVADCLSRRSPGFPASSGSC